MMMDYSDRKDRFYRFCMQVKKKIELENRTKRENLQVEICCFIHEYDDS